MRRSVTALLTATALAAAALPAGASAARPADDGPPPSAEDQRDPNRVHRLKPWKPNFTYRMKRAAAVHDELNGRADTVAQVLEGQWWPIDCQLVNVTQNGRVLWNHIPNVGWVADSAMQTFDDDRLQGSPTCPEPGPNHVWFKQPWALGKEYRFARDQQLLDRPGGVPAGKQFPRGAWTTVNCHQRAGGQQWLFVDLRGPGSGFVPAASLTLWQDGVPQGLGPCARTSTPVREYAALGDSYASGLGAGDADIAGGCRRSELSYWGLLRDRLKGGIVTSDAQFVACAGATSVDVRNEQLGALSPSTRLVTLSAGGNDFGFSTIVKACIKPFGTSCEEAVDDHFEDSDVSRVRGALKALYRAVRAEAPSAQVMVLGYPEPLDPERVDGCGDLDEEEGPMLHEIAVKLNRTIKQAIGKRRGFRFIGLRETFADHPACNSTSTDWINGVVPDDLDASFHPNALGHEAIAGKLAAAAPRYFR